MIGNPHALLTLNRLSLKLNQLILEANRTRDKIAQAITHTQRHMNNAWSEMVIVIHYLAIYCSFSTRFSQTIQDNSSLTTVCTNLIDLLQPCSFQYYISMTTNDLMLHLQQIICNQRSVFTGGWIVIYLFICLAKKKPIPTSSTFGTGKRVAFPTSIQRMRHFTCVRITSSTSAQNVWETNGPQLDRFEAPSTLVWKFSGHLSEQELKESSSLSQLCRWIES